jgi:hypothetical protein
MTEEAIVPTAPQSLTEGARVVWALELWTGRRNSERYGIASVCATGALW